MVDSPIPTELSAETHERNQTRAQPPSLSARVWRDQALAGDQPQHNQSRSS